jgi:hypothetical protein
VTVACANVAMAANKADAIKSFFMIDLLSAKTITAA